jgi:hypothetical protein
MGGTGNDSVNPLAATHEKLPAQQEQNEGKNDRKKLAEELGVSPAQKAHAKLRQMACRTVVAPRPPVNDAQIYNRRVHLMSKAL